LQLGGNRIIICWQCQNWEKCFHYRYYNERKPYMKEICREKDSWGQDVIYVSQCEKYKYEEQGSLT